MPKIVEYEYKDVWKVKKLIYGDFLTVSNGIHEDFGGAKDQIERIYKKLCKQNKKKYIVEIERLNNWTCKYYFTFTWGFEEIRYEIEYERMRIKKV